MLDQTPNQKQGARSALEKLRALFSGSWGTGKTWCAVGSLMGYGWLLFPFQNKAIPSPLFLLLLSFSLSSFSPFFPILETFYSSCQYGGFLWLSDCKQKITKPIPHSACMDNADRYYIVWLIYLYRAIDFLLLSVNQKVASDYWLVNLHVFYVHCIGQL